MSEKKYVVPEGMLKAAIESVQDGGFDRYRKFLETAIQWLAENPIVPSGRHLQEMSDSLTKQGDVYHSTEAYCTEWQRRMFLRPQIGKFAEATARSFRGVTLTKEEADYLHDQINMVTGR